MRVLVFGAGAMGSLIGGMLSSRHEVTLVGRPDHVDAIRKCGLYIVGKTELRPRVWAMTKVPAAPQDIVIVSTKAYDTSEAVTALRRFWRSSIFLTLQNGLGNAEIIGERAERVAVGTTSHGAMLIRGGLVNHTGLGDTFIGTHKGVAPRDVVNLCEELTACGFHAKYSNDIKRNIWMKVIVNAAINPLTAIANVENGRLLDSQQLRALFSQICSEAVDVARAEGYDISLEEALKTAQKIAKHTAKNRSSMLQDLDRGRRTEVSEISGAIVEKGRRHGISLPAIDVARLSILQLDRGS